MPASLESAFPAQGYGELYVGQSQIQAKVVVQLLAPSVHPRHFCHVHIHQDPCYAC